MPQIFTDVRTRDVGSDRRNDAWSPENVLVDTVARMQQDLVDIRAENQLLRTPAVPPVVHTPREALNVALLVPMSRHRERLWWTHCQHIMGRRVDWQTIDGSLRKRLGRWGKTPPYLP